MRSSEVYVLLTMDCEPALTDVTPYARQMSGSGPADHAEGERSILAYAARAKERGFPVTFFLHPEVAAAHRDLLLDLQREGACLGLHLHPYKFGKAEHAHDLGAYTASQQLDILGKAADAWEAALGQRPQWFRAGYFSANDATFSVLEQLGFRGGSLSNPGRVLPAHYSVWAGADPYPRRANFAFRQIAGDSDFVEVPASVDFERPVQVGEAREQGYEWPYIPSQQYDHPSVIAHILERIKRDSPPCGVVVTDTHNDQDYSEPGHPATRNLTLILDTIEASGAQVGLQPVPCTIASLCDRVLSETSSSQ